jgi:hypothetical protein
MNATTTDVVQSPELASMTRAEATAQDAYRFFNPYVAVHEHKRVVAWPNAEKEPPRADYVPLSVALGRRYTTDAYFTCYSVAQRPYRLNSAALEHITVWMSAVVFDVDAPNKNATDEWRAGELPKIVALLALHPGGFYYETKNGYRIVYAAANPIRIVDLSDADAWKLLYPSWVRYLKRRFGIVADLACKEWQRLFRLPFVTRDGQVENRPTIGDPDKVGPWHCELAAEDMADAKISNNVNENPSSGPRSLSNGIVYNLFSDRGALGKEISAGKWRARCPWSQSHTSGADYDSSTVVYAPSPGKWHGAFHCSHAHCEHRDFDDVLREFTDAQLTAAGWHIVKDEPKKEKQQEQKTDAAAAFTVPLCDFLGDEEEADEPEEMLIEGLAPVGVVIFMAGEPKVAKTFKGLHMGLAVAAGKPVFGKFATKQGPVVAICEEDTEKQLRKRVWWLARGLGVDPRNLPFRISAMKGFRIEEDEWFARLRMEATGAKMILLDALTRIHGLDENSRTDMQRVTRKLTELATSTGAAVIVLHHYKKPAGNGADAGLRSGQKMRGTGDLYALARAIIGVSKEKDGTLKVDPESNYFEGEPFAVSLSVDPPQKQALEPGQKRKAVFSYLGQEKQADDTRADDATLRALKDSTEPVSVHELRDIVGMGKASDASVKRLASAGSITPIKYKPEGKRQASDRWVLTARRGDFEASE